MRAAIVRLDSLANQILFDLFFQLKAGMIRADSDFHEVILTQPLAFGFCLLEPVHKWFSTVEPQLAGSGTLRPLPNWLQIEG